MMMTKINKLSIGVLPLALLLGVTGCIPKASERSQSDHSSKVQATPGASAPKTTTVSSNNPSKDSNGDASSGQGSTDASSTPTPTSTPPTSVSSQSLWATAMTFVSATQGWIGGEGFISHTSDGGKTWTRQYSGETQILQLSFINEQQGWALAEQPDSHRTDATVRYILRTSDGGQHWTSIASLKDVDSLHFSSETNGVAGSLQTTDGGASWHSISLPKDMFGSPYFNDTNHGWAVTSSGQSIVVKRTTDGGQTWNSTLTKSLSDPAVTAWIRSSQADDAWIILIGGSGMTQTSYSVFHTQDGGQHWTTVIAESTAGGGPAPGVSASDTSHPGPGLRPGDLAAINPQTAVMIGICAACGDYGQVSTGFTTNGGATWINGHANIPTADARLSFPDAKHGWLITSNFGHPSELYRTTDAGVHWQSIALFGPSAGK